jgi:hypothetical protein
MRLYIFEKYSFISHDHLSKTLNFINLTINFLTIFDNAGIKTAAEFKNNLSL